MGYWCVAQLQPSRDALALHFLAAAGFEAYAPRVRERRTVAGRRVIRTPLLFPAYAFIRVELQWHSARWLPGIVRIVCDGDRPARVPDAVIDGLKAREGGDGLIELPRPPRFKPGDRLRVLHGPLAGQVGLYAGQRPRQRIEILLRLLGGRAVLAADAVEAVDAR